MDINELIRLINLLTKTQKEVVDLKEKVANLRTENFSLSYYNRVSPALEDHLRDNGHPGTIHWVNGWWWHNPSSGDRYTYDRQTWKTHAESIKTDSPIIMLDVEGPVMHAMRDPHNPDRDRVLDWYLDATHVYKVLFPDKEIAWYAIPWVSPWLWATHPSDYQDWIDREHEICQKLSGSVSFLQPSIYDHYKDNAYNKVNNHLWIDEALEERSVKESVSIALTNHKKVIPAIWRMYHNGNPLFGYTPIPKEEFTKHLRYAFDSVVNNNYIDGFMFWNRQRVNWEDFNSGPRGMDPLLVPKWLELSEKESYNIVAEMAGLKKFLSGTELPPANIIPSPVNPNRKPINKNASQITKLK